MNHNAFIYTSLWPYVKNILKIFKNYPELQKKIRIMYREEARKLTDFNTNNRSEQRKKYEEIISIFTKFSEKYIKKKELENLTRPRPNSPSSKVMSKVMSNYINSKNKHNNNEEKYIINIQAQNQSCRILINNNKADLQYFTIVEGNDSKIISINENAKDIFNGSRISLIKLENKNSHKNEIVIFKPMLKK